MPKRTSVEQRERVAVMLREGVRPEVRRALAKLYGVTERTLRNWARVPAGRAGRPPRPEEVVEAARAACHVALLRHGFRRWWKTIWKCLEGTNALSQALVREAVTGLKRRNASLQALLRELRRVKVKVRFGDALWALDETMLGRLEDGTAVQGIVVREVASTRTLVVSVGSAATAEDLIRVLEALRLARGALPLVICMDNGPAMRSELVALYLRFHEVLVLFNLPYVSEHNATVERGHRDIKELSGLGKGVVLRHYEEAVAALEPAVKELNEGRPLASRGWKTAQAVDSETPRWYASVERTAFFQGGCRAVRDAVQGCSNDHDRRKAEREALLCYLESLSLIERTRGGAPYPTG